MKKYRLFFLTLLLIYSLDFYSIIAQNTTSSTANCIRSFMPKYNQLLPLETINKYYSVPATAKMNYLPGLMSKKFNVDRYSYRWKSERKEKIKLLSREIEQNVSNEIGLTWVGNDLFMMPRKATPKENFVFFYRNVSEAEKNSNLDKAATQIKQEGHGAKTTDEAVGIGKEMSTGNIDYKTVEGIGEAAVWNIKEKSLIVLVGNVSFQVIAHISANQDENITLAKKLATEVINKCK